MRMGPNNRLGVPTVADVGRDLHLVDGHGQAQVVTDEGRVVVVYTGRIMRTAPGHFGELMAGIGRVDLTAAEAEVLVEDLLAAIAGAREGEVK